MNTNRQAGKQAGRHAATCRWYIIYITFQFRAKRFMHLFPL